MECTEVLGRIHDVTVVSFWGIPFSATLSNGKVLASSMGILMNHTGFIRISCCFFASLSHQAFSLFDTERSGAIDARELKADSRGERCRMVLKIRLDTSRICS